MKNSQTKGFANIILIALVVILAGALGYTILLNKPVSDADKQQQSSETTQSQNPQSITSIIPANIQPAQTTPNEIAGWKAYINNQYGFGVKYPVGYSEFHKSGDSSTSFRSTEGCKSLHMGGGEWPADCQDYSISIQKNKMSVEGAGVTKTYLSVADIQAEKIVTSGGMWDNLTQVVVQFQRGQDWYVQTFTFNTEKAIDAEGVMNQILTTFKFTTSTKQVSLPTTCVDKSGGEPVITSVSPSSGPVGTKVEIRGCNFLGFEGDRDAVFVRNDGAEIPLYGGSLNSSSSEEELKGKLVKVTLQPYCASGSEIGRYSGVASACKKVDATSGTYQVYVTAWGKKSNEATFELTPSAQVSQAPAEYSLFKSVDKWVLDYQDRNHQVSSGSYSMVCSDGKKGNTTSDYVFSMNSNGYGERPGDINTPYKKVLDILQINGWQKCRNFDETDMQSPFEIFIKNNKLIGIFRHLSMGTGNALQVSIQY